QESEIAHALEHFARKLFSLFPALGMRGQLLFDKFAEAAPEDLVLFLEKRHQHGVTHQSPTGPSTFSQRPWHHAEIMSAPRILIVDDDAWILRMVATVLDKRGYVIDTAVDGAEALERVEESTPDLVITDIMMPRMDGWTLIRTLRARPETAFTPVLF